MYKKFSIIPFASIRFSPLKVQHNPLALKNKIILLMAFWICEMQF